MLRLLIFFALCLPVSAQGILAGVLDAQKAVVAGSTPTLIQVKATPSDILSQSPLKSNAAFMYVCFANTTQVNNTVVVRLTTPSTTGNVTSVADDGSSSNTYTLQASETAGSETLAIYTAPVVHTSRCVTVTFTLTSGATLAGNQVKLYEYENVATSSPLDVSCTGTATSGTAPACGSSMTPTVANDLILTFMDVVTFSSKPATSVTFTAQTGSSPTYTLTDAAGTDWTASQNAVDAATSAITPSLTVSQAVTRANIVGIALKSATSGSGFSGVHVNNVIFNAPQFSQSTSFTGTSLVVQFPCSGNDIWIMIGQGASSSTDNTTGIGSDSNSNTFTARTNVYSSGDGFSIRWWEATTAGGVVCNGTEKFTISFTANPTFMFLMMLDVSNSTGYDSTAGNTTTNTTSATNPPTTFAGASITPSTNNGVILSYMNQDFDTLSAVSTSAAGGVWVGDNLSCPNVTDGCGGSGHAGANYAYAGSGFEQDGGLMIDYYGASTSAVSITWTVGTLGNTQNQSIGPYFSSSAVVK